MPVWHFDRRAWQVAGRHRLPPVLTALAALALTPHASAAQVASPQPGPTATIIFQDDFESGSLKLWEQLPNSGRYRVATDPRRVKTGARSLEALYTAQNAYGVLTRWFMPGYDEVYVRFSVMFEEGFANPGMHFLMLAGNRIDDKSSATGKAGVKPTGGDFFYAGLDPEFVPREQALRPFHFYTYWPEMECCHGNRFYQSEPRSALADGRWHDVVVHVRLNTPGQDDGSQALWIDGEKKIEVRQLRWRATTELRLNQLRFDNWMDGGAPKTQRIWLDDLTVWTP